jgi:hypothetical protein
MVNGWKVIWFDGDKKLVRKFEGDSPRESGAVDFGKRLQASGHNRVHIVSQRKAFAPPQDKRQAPERGMLWCPYCLKWRNFVETSIQGQDGTRSPIQWRCPICTISVNNFYVRRHNLDMVLRFEGRAEMQSENLIRRKLRGR